MIFSFDIPDAYVDKASDADALRAAFKCDHHVVPPDMKLTELPRDTVVALLDAIADSIGEIRTSQWRDMLGEAFQQRDRASERLVETQDEYAALEQLVVNTVVNWQGGCMEGKRDFLSALDLTWPMTDYSINVRFTAQAGNDLDDVEEAIGVALRNHIEGLNEISEFDCTELG